jgi:gas vesicle protein
MRDDNAYSGAHLLVTFMAGAAAGVVAALLLAPQSGTESRNQIRGWAKEAQSKAGRLPKAVKAAYSEAAHSAKDAFTDAFNRQQERDERVAEPV